MKARTESSWTRALLKPYTLVQRGVQLDTGPSNPMQALFVSWGL